MLKKQVLIQIKLQFTKRKLYSGIQPYKTSRKLG